MAEVDSQEQRGTRLTYAEMLNKYTERKAGPTASTLRGHVRKYVLGPRFSSRVLVSELDHLNALQKAVPLCTDTKGRVRWSDVRAGVIERNGRPFGSSTLRKQWETVHY